jgi:rhamnose transport system permease protein
VKRIKFWLFVVTGMVSAIAGIVFTFRFASARADNATGLELSVVAVVLLGGVSIFGGRGNLLGVICAVLLLGTLRNALTLNDVSAEVLTIVTGSLLLLSVLGPSVTARVREALRRGRGTEALPASTNSF